MYVGTCKLGGGGERGTCPAAKHFDIKDKGYRKRKRWGVLVTCSILSCGSATKRFDLKLSTVSFFTWLN